MESRKRPHDFSYKNDIIKKQRTRKTCPGCDVTYSRSYFVAVHREKFLVDNIWTCNSSNQPNQDAVIDANGNTVCHEANNDTVENDCQLSEEDKGDNEESLRHALRKNLHKYIRNRIATQDLEEPVSEDEFEVWDKVSADEINEDIEQIRHYQSEITDRSQTMSLTMWLCLIICLWQSTFMLPDVVISQILKFLKTLLVILCKSHPFLSGLAALFPGTLYMLWKVLNIKRDSFRKYVVCKKCAALYTIEECSLVVEGKRVSAKCHNREFPNHHQLARRRICGELLMKSVQLLSGENKLYPYKMYCYKSIVETFQRFLLRPNFENKCEIWRKRKTVEGCYFDIYDGRIWEEFQTPKYANFLCSKHSYGIMLNLDWFQLFEHVKYSVGAIYGVVLNLPRNDRFKIQNVILLGIIPDLGKEPLTNTFIKPLVDELLDLWNVGVKLKSYEEQKEVIVKLALMCVGCDVPATRKLCGFLGHAASLGCSKCLKIFPGTVGNISYAGFDREKWPNRNLEDYRKSVKEVSKAKTKTDREKIESKLGVRYSELSRLPYFDPIRMSIIDPMHNLYMGTAKHMVKVWLETGNIDKDAFGDIQNKLDTVEVPASIGKIPRKIASSFGGFTAEQWKNWSNLFSIYGLKGHIPDRHLQNWRFFVLASRLICSRFVTFNEIELFDQYILTFCRGVQELYGEQYVTPNMHLHAHLAQCLLDYGPMQSFWLFSFERYNGHLGKIPSNNRSVELQFMRRFLRNSFVSEIEFPSKYSEYFQADLQKMMLDENCIETIDTYDKSKLIELSYPETTIANRDWCNLKAIVPKNGSPTILSNDEALILRKTYKRLYADYPEGNRVIFPVSYMKFTVVSIGNEIIGSVKSRYKCSSLIMANWNASGGKIVDNEKHLWPGYIETFLRHNIVVDGEQRVHFFAKVFWLAQRPELKRYCGAPVEVWSKDAFDIYDESAFIPVQRIRCKFIQTTGQVRNKHVMFVCPITKHLLY